MIQEVLIIIPWAGQDRGKKRISEGKPLEAAIGAKWLL